MHGAVPPLSHKPSCHEAFKDMDLISISSYRTASNGI